MFMLDHLEKHFTLAGCGIRFLLDVYIFLQAKGKELHRDKLKKEFRKRNQEAFFKQVEETANAWFGEVYHVGDTELERVILLSGTFGTTSQKFENRQEKIQKKYKNEKVIKVMYFLTRTFPEYSYMCNIYPFLYKASGIDACYVDRASDLCTCNKDGPHPKGSWILEKDGEKRITVG